MMSITTILLLILVGVSQAQDLGQSIITGDLGSVQKIIEADEKGKLLNKEAFEDWTPVHLSVIYDQQSILEYLLARGAGPNPEDKLGLTPLLHAVKLSDMETAKLLMSNGANPLATSKAGNTAVHFAVGAGSVNLIDEFLGRGVDVNARNKADVTPLHMAVRKKDLNLVNHLISKGANVNAADDQGATPLHDAAMVGSAEITQLLLRNGALVATKNKTHDVDAAREATPLHIAVIYGNSNLFPVFLRYQGLSAIRNKYERTPLMVAISQGLTPMVDALLENGAAVQDSTNLTQPMDMALEMDDLDLAAKLLDRGADVDRPNNKRFPPLMVAITNQQVEMVKLLIDRGAAVMVPADGVLPLERAIEMQHIEMMQMLIDAGADISDPDTKGRTPLYIAVENQNVAMARLLLDKGANATFISTTWKQTPIQVAIDQKNIRMLNLLVSKGALTYTEGDFKDDPIAMAIKQGYPFLAEVLRASDANVFRKDEDGAGFLEFAIYESKDPRVFDALIKSGISVNEPTKKYGTPLHLASDRGNEAAVRVLIGYGADVNALNDDGKTPLDVAKGSVDQILSVNGGRKGVELK